MVCIPSSFHYSIKGVQQVPGAESGNPPDNWSAAIYAAVIGEAKQSFTVNDSNPTININDGIHGGAFMSTTKTNVVLEVIE